MFFDFNCSSLAISDECGCMHPLLVLLPAFWVCLLVSWMTLHCLGKTPCLNIHVYRFFGYFPSLFLFSLYHSPIANVAQQRVVRDLPPTARGVSRCDYLPTQYNEVSRYTSQLLPHNQNYGLSASLSFPHAKLRLLRSNLFVSESIHNSGGSI